MENFYFIEKDGTKLGPFKLDDLKSKAIYSNELVWRSDSEVWKQASEFEELTEVYISNPPLILHKQKSAYENQENNSKIRTVDISEQLVFSIIIGFLVSFVIMILAHMSPSDWSVMPITNGRITYSSVDKVSSCSYKCVFDERHAANCSGLSVSDVHDKLLTIEEVFSGSFEHILAMGIFGLVLSILVYFFKNVNFQVIKE